MATQSATLAELRQAIGHETKPVKIHIDYTLISRFVDATEDPNPLFHDEEKAEQGPYGSIVAPPGLLCASMMRGGSAFDILMDKLPPRTLDGGGEWEFIRPIRLGDKIVVTTKLVDITERAGRVGTMTILTSETIWRNQRDEIVARSLATAIKY